ncbi:MAG TPA: PAAR domain-containing protein [Polyangiaceae bacterium]|nr:PAAR domain-containing protein [Polyangiaceae bacterium]
MAAKEVADKGPKPAPPALGPAPVMPLSGEGVARDAFANVVNNAVNPFQSALDPELGTVTRVASAVNGVLSVVNAPIELMNAGLALATNFVSDLVPPFPAATQTALHVGAFHGHTHPPSLVPPAPPVPLPSVGMVSMPCCVSVLINGLPAARAGDIGFALTCGGFAPVFEIITGSSKVFIGGARAARQGDLTKHCLPKTSVTKLQLALTLGPAALNAGAAAEQGNEEALVAVAKQAVADGAALAVKALIGKDPAVGPGFGGLVSGSGNVVIGGIPLPPSEWIKERVKTGLPKLAKGLARGVRGGRRQGRLFCAQCT